MPKRTPVREERNLPLLRAIVEDGRKHYLIASDAEINPNDFSRYVNGKAVPSRRTKERIAKALGRSVEELFGADDQVMAS